jgi:hypothetical protein
MATKLCFFINKNNEWEEKLISYTFIPGLSYDQKQKNVISFHFSIQDNLNIDISSILEISTKSQSPLGRSLSAFNLKLNGLSFESVYQSCKVFNDTEQFEEVKYLKPIEAKHYLIEHSKNKLLTGFNYNGTLFSLFPQSMFYDFLYLQTVLINGFDLEQLISYHIFTDIEFNEKKQLNSQARAVAILVSLIKRNLLDEAMKSIERFRDLVYQNVIHDNQAQLSLF